MRRRVEWAKRALKALSRLDRPTQDRILTALDELVSENRGDVRRLASTRPAAFRLRVGAWRIVFSPLEEGSILVPRIGSRGDVYKR